MRSYRLPNRERNVISQTYNDGIVRIYSTEDAADPGHMPVEQLTLKAMLMYAEQRVGITRFYTAQQYHDDVERVVRVQRAGVIANRDIAETEDCCSVCYNCNEIVAPCELNTFVIVFIYVTLYLHTL